MHLILLLLFGGLAVPVAAAPPERFHEALQALRAVGPGGKGNAEAGRAWKTVASAEAAQLTKVLQAMDGANDLAANWLGAAGEAVVDRELKAGRALPVADLGEFVLDTQHHPRARQMAFAWLRKVEPASAERLVGGFLQDPSAELRREPVARAIGEATQLAASGQGAGAALLFRQALGAARDVDQIEAIATELKKLGRPVDLPRQFGFLTRWHVAGPFDNTGRSGFAQVYPPETQIDLGATYEGKGGPAKWVSLVSTNELGLVDVNQAFGMLKEATAYAVTDFVCERERPAELRLGCKNAWKIWLNGRLVFGRDEYHRGAEIDQYRLPVSFRAGKNTILIKICQNEQKEEWTREWEFQLRVCDEIGSAILPADAPTTRTASLH